MTDALEDLGGTVSIGGRTITNLRFADDIDGSAGEEEELANLSIISTKLPQPTAWRSVENSKLMTTLVASTQRLK